MFSLVNLWIIWLLEFSSYKDVVKMTKVNWVCNSRKLHVYFKLYWKRLLESASNKHVNYEKSCFKDSYMYVKPFIYGGNHCKLWFDLFYISLLHSQHPDNTNLHGAISFSYWWFLRENIYNIFITQTDLYNKKLPNI